MTLTPSFQSLNTTPTNPEPGETVDITLTHATEGAAPDRTIDLLIFTPDLADAKLVEGTIGLSEGQTTQDTFTFNAPPNVGVYELRGRYVEPGGGLVPPSILIYGNIQVGDVANNTSSISATLDLLEPYRPGEVIVEYVLSNTIESGNGQALSPTVQIAVDGAVVDTESVATTPGESKTVTRTVTGLPAGDKEVCISVV